MRGGGGGGWILWILSLERRDGRGLRGGGRWVGVRSL